MITSLNVDSKLNLVRTTTQRIFNPIQTELAQCAKDAGETNIRSRTKPVMHVRYKFPSLDGKAASYHGKLMLKVVLPRSALAFCIVEFIIRLIHVASVSPDPLPESRFLRTIGTKILEKSSC